MPPATTEKSAGAPPQNVNLDRLLKLPDSYGRPSQERSGVGEEIWRSRFAKARNNLSGAEEALSEAKKGLEDAAGDSGQWNVSAPGGTNESSPVSYKLRQEIRRQTEAKERYERDLRSLEIEANIASVPEDWRN